MRRTLMLTGCLVLALLTAARGQADDLRQQAVQTYAQGVHAIYQAALQDAQALQQAVEGFLAQPDDQTLQQARQAWLRSRESYGQTEVFRFYGGPIDGVGPDAGWPEGVEGPESRLNAWPLNEAYIDYVKGRPDAGIVNDPDVRIARDTLIQKNAAQDEADVSTGYHAIEFLLWGQDLSQTGPGERPASDYADATDNQRRRQYLRQVTDLLVQDLTSLTQAWAPDQAGNFRQRFLDRPADAALGDIITGLATLSGFELASERLAVPLDSGDQEDEHSCFSDNTHRDFVANLQGIANVWSGRYGQVEGTGLNELVAQADPELARKLDEQVQQTLAAAEALPTPIDRVLASPAGSEGRQQMEGLVDELYTQAELLLEAAQTLNVESRIAGE